MEKKKLIINNLKKHEFVNYNSCSKICNKYKDLLGIKSKYKL
jgi:hypothetical protein